MIAPRGPSQPNAIHQTPGSWPFANRAGLRIERVVVGARTYNDTETVPQRRTERLELGWGSPRQYRSHGGDLFSQELDALEESHHFQIKRIK